MLNKGKRNVLGIMIDAVDYEAAKDFVIRAARERRGVAITALAVHGLMTGVLDRVHKFRLNHFDLMVPDGQPVRWAINWLYRTGLAGPVIGRNLTLKLCEGAAAEGLPIYFYGSTPEVLAGLKESLAAEVSKIKAGSLTEGNLKRLEQERQDHESGQQPNTKWSRKKKILVALLIVVAAGGLVVAIKHRCKAPNPCPEPDTTSDYDF